MIRINLTTDKLAAVLDQVPAGITVFDLEGQILYYNDYSTRFVDRRPEYIGRNLASCHKKDEIVVRIKQMFSDLAAGKKDEVYYESQRGENKLGVTVTRFSFEGEHVGFIQCFSVIKQS